MGEQLEIPMYQNQPILTSHRCRNNNTCNKKEVAAFANRLITCLFPYFLSCLIDNTHRVEERSTIIDPRTEPFVRTRVRTGVFQIT